MHLQFLDYAVVIFYGVFLLVLAQWVSREKAGHEKNTQDYFLAGRSLPWWAIGASLIAANISAEQIIGMSGSAYVLGFAIASYEWMAALTLIIVGKYLLPVFLKHKIYTMPQFLEQRYDHRVRMVMATFWLGVYVFVNLTSILWLGSLAINSVTGLEQTYGLIILGAFAISYSLYGGLKAVALTDIIQVVLLVFGGLLIAWITMNEISGGEGAIAAVQERDGPGEVGGVVKGIAAVPVGRTHQDARDGDVDALPGHGLAPQGELCRGLHAEQNAILQAAYHGVSIQGSVLFCTNFPCVICSKMLINAGIGQIFYLEGYPDSLSETMLKEAGMDLHRIEMEDDL